MQTVPYILGTAHPTGYPSVILAGWLFTHVFAVGAVAWRMALLCAVCYLIAALALYSAVRALAADRPSAGATALIYAFSPLVWGYATHVDVFAFNAALSAIAFRRLVFWRITGRTAHLVVAALMIGLSLGAHLTALWLLPGFALMLVAAHRGPGLRAGAAAALAFVAGLAVYAYSPIASAVNFGLARDPTLALGLPPCRPFFDYGHPSNLHNFLWMLVGARVDAPQSVAVLGRFYEHLDRIGAPFVQLAQTYPAKTLPFVALSVVWLAFAVVGLWRLARTGDAIVAGASVLCALGGIPFTISFAAESDPVRYWIVPFWFLSLLAGIGVASAARFAGARFAASRAPGLSSASSTPPRSRSAASTPPRSRSAANDRAGSHPAWGYVAVLGGVTFAFAIVEQFGARELYAQPHDRLGWTYVDRVRAMTPENAIVIVPWTPATPLGYAAYVERSFGSRIVDTATLDHESGYVSHWLARRPVYVVDYRRPNVSGIVLGGEQRLGLSPSANDDAKIWKVERAAPTAMPAPDTDGTC